MNKKIVIPAIAIVALLALTVALPVWARNKVVYSASTIWTSSVPDKVWFSAPTDDYPDGKMYHVRNSTEYQK